jgi:dihydrodipicolinate synthase/N-acetylneuraminate lyase
MDLPVMIYNNPSARNDLDPGTIARLSEVDGVVAVKDCSVDACRIAAVADVNGALAAIQ